MKQQLNPLKYDPTRTTALRNKFAADLRGRFDSLNKEIRQLIVEEDALGLSDGDLVVNGRWSFLPVSAKLTAFRNWLVGKLNEKVFNMTTDGYVEAAYDKGADKGATAVSSQDVRGGVPIPSSTIVSVLKPRLAVEKIALIKIQTSNALKGIGDAVVTRVSDIMAIELVRGTGPREVGRLISKAVSDIGKKRATTLARTEIIRAHAEGALDVMESMGVKHIGVEVEWSTTGDAKVCPKCRPLEGIVIPIQAAHGMFPRHPNCILGDSVVTSTQPLSLIRAHYSGQVFKVVTSKGRRLSVTQNHVLLTQRGWVRACQLTDSDYLVDAPYLDGDVFQSPDDNKGVTTIADQFAAATEMASVTGKTSTNTRPEYLHGDGKFINGEIDIIRFDGGLGDYIQAILRRQGIKNVLVDRYVAPLQSLFFDSQSLLSKFFIRAAAASDSLMGFSGIESVFFRGSLCHHDAVSGSDVAGYPQPDHLFSGEPAIESKPLIQLKTAASVFVELSQLIERLSRDRGFTSRAGFLAGSDSPKGFDFLSKHFGRAVQLSSHLVDGKPGSVQSDGLVYDRIVEVVSCHFENIPVYDLETSESVYTVNGIISSNCRCSPIPSFEKVDKEKLRNAIQASLTASYSKKGKGKKTTKAPVSTAYPWPGDAAEHFLDSGKKT